MPRKQARAEWHHIPVVFTDWDCSYHFGLKAGKYDTGCIGQYSELSVVTLIGTVFGAQKEANLAENQIVHLHLYFKDEAQLALDESSAAGGAYIQNSVLSVGLSVPKSSSAYLLNALSAGKINAYTLTIAKLFRRKAALRGIGIHTHFDLNEW